MAEEKLVEVDLDKLIEKLLNGIAGTIYERLFNWRSS